MKLCEHLETPLLVEVSGGNSIKEVSDNAWSNAKLVVILENKIEKLRANAEVEKYDFVQFFEINDNHYDPQSGYYCNKCKQAVTSPQ
ncbi:MAG: hypothetical protein PHF63_03300 [Herbinix sp.]|nr:hypothetical protein [Herbinix sp.]